MIKSTSSAKKGEGLALLAAHIRRNQPDLSPLWHLLLAGSLGHRTSIRHDLEDIDVLVRLGTFRNEHSRSIAAIRRVLADLHEQGTGIACRVSYPPQRGLVPGPRRLRTRGVGKPLIEQIKAPMTSTQAQAINERLSAEDGPRRKLPPRP
ncbi:hypothetical protein [Streptomyces sp. Ag109_G2-15]|uniref:hypothetical protein n=1 Tax=Streptomyces sp. Ag109_G2-15 TaxID=1938850 RepID=UPI0011810C1F|nr:hypothetical protein [Streptomyces sp. Ag109_G2-15]